MFLPSLVTFLEICFTSTSAHSFTSSVSNCIHSYSPFLFLPRLSTKSAAAEAASSPFFRGTEEPLLFVPSLFTSSRSVCDLSYFATLFPWHFNQRPLLATKWSLFSFVLKISKILSPLLLACVGIYLRLTTECSTSIRSSISYFISSLLSR